MKKISYVFAFSLLAISCNEEILKNSDNEDDSWMSFRSECIRTKTDVETDGTAFTITWNESDQIGIYGVGSCEGSNYAYTALPDSENPSSCAFTPSEKGRVFTCAEGSQNYYAYYPYGGAAGDDPSSVIISLPYEQEMYKAGYVDQIAPIYAMKAHPVSASGEDSASFIFEGLYSIVQFNLVMSSSIQAPISKVKLKSKDTYLAFDKATVDLTSLGRDINIVEGKNEIQLSFSNEFKITSTEKKIYMVVAPGHHSTGNLSLVLEATDGSASTIELPSVTFEPGKTYVQSFSVDAKSFTFENPFEVSVSKSSCSVGEELVFSITGCPNTIEFWPGERPHSWEYKDSGEYKYPDIFISFNSFVQAGNQPQAMSIKYSSDYDGSGTEASILSATWVDIRDRFAWSTDTSVDTTPKNTDAFTPSGKVNVSDCIKDDGQAYFAFFYHIDPFNSALNNGRTQVYLNSITVTSENDGKSTDLFVQASDTPFIIGASYSSDSTKPSYNTSLNSMRFTSTFKPTTERNAYMVLPAIVKQGIAQSADTGIIIKDATEGMIYSYKYSFASSGTYHVVMVGSIDTFAGTQQYIKEFSISVK